MTTVKHPREFDGEPHEVALEAGKQFDDALEDAREALDGFNWAARGAWLSSEEHRTGEMPDGDQFWRSPQGRRILALYDLLGDLNEGFSPLKEAAAWNPRSQV